MIVILLTIFFIPAVLFSLLSFVIHQEYLRLYALWMALLSIASYVGISQVPKEENYTILFYILLITIFIVYSSIFIRKYRIKTTKINNNPLKSDDKRFRLARKIEYLTCFAYGGTAILVLNTFYGNKLLSYQPAWIVYFLATTMAVALGFLLRYMIFKIIIFAHIINKRKIADYWQYFSYGVGTSILVLLLFNINFAYLVIKETIKITGKKVNFGYPYCINVSVSRNNNVDTLLFLSSLNMKPKIITNNSTTGRYREHKSPNHAFLKIEKKNQIYLYQWSYYGKKWLYLEPKYFARANLDTDDTSCTPQQNYLQNIPWIFSQK